MRVFNRTSLEDAGLRSRDEALMRSLVAMHAVVSVRGGRFFSLTDPPEALRRATAACRNLGVWPVLVGSPGEQDAMLASPIILYDYPEIAPKVLAISSMPRRSTRFDVANHDAHRRGKGRGRGDRRPNPAAHRTDRVAGPRATCRAARRSPLAGALRKQIVQILAGWTSGAAQVQAMELEFGRPFQRAAGSWAGPLRTRRLGSLCRAAGSDRIVVDNVELRPGDRVRLRPGSGATSSPGLAGKIATIEAIEQDYEGRFHVAVTLDDDPGRDLGQSRQPGHRFFFGPEEIRFGPRGNVLRDAP